YRIQMSLNYEGIGASLQIVDDYVTIMNVLEGGPAAMAGTLTTNDRITGVGQGHDGPFTDVIGWRLDDVVQLIRGKAGTTVRLQRLSARGDRAHRAIHQPRSGRAAARYGRQARGAGRSGARAGLRRPARGAGRPVERVGVGDLRRRDPGLSPRHHSGTDHLRQ